MNWFQKIGGWYIPGLKSRDSLIQEITNLINLNRIQPNLYHGTCSRVLPLILKEGLQPFSPWTTRSDMASRMNYGTVKGVYLTNNKSVADSYARAAAKSQVTGTEDQRGVIDNSLPFPKDVIPIVFSVPIMAILNDIKDNSILERILNGDEVRNVVIDRTIFPNELSYEQIQ